MECVKFDPGIGQYAICFSQNIEVLMSLVMANKSPNQRRFKYQSVFPQILNSFKSITGFYAGCLLWATYIKYSDNESEKEIIENGFYNQNIEDEEKFDFLYEIDFLLDYFEKCEKDARYFMNKSANIPDKWFNIAKFYKEFLVLNNNFVKTKTTTDLLLPEGLRKPNETALKTINNCIISIVEMNGDLSRFIEIF